ncbi:hypothetical protein BH11PLA2_BH11PLA2_38240 [soil metagenome]
MSKSKKVEHVSDAQAKAETEMVQCLSQQLGVPLSSKTISLSDGSTVQIDGYYQDSKRRVLVESFARTKQIKPGQKRKILADMLKLIFVAQSLLEQEPDLLIEKHLLFQSEQVANSFTGYSWAARACEMFRIHIQVQRAAEATFQEVVIAENDQGWGFHANQD